MLKLLYICIAAQLLYSAAAKAQEVPPISCPNYFQYVQQGNECFGILMLVHSPTGPVNVDVSFSQREPVQSNFYGRLSLYDERNAIQNLANGLPVSYRVDFPFTNVLPKLTKIAVNAQIICSASDYPPPSTTLNLQHTWKSTSTSAGEERQFISFKRPVPYLPIVQPNNNNNYSQAISVVSIENPFLSKVRQPKPVPSIVTQPLQQQNKWTTSQVQSQQQQSVQSNSNCGVEDRTIQPLIHGGTALKRGQFPWLVAIYRKGNAALFFLCEGTLVSGKTILTAASYFAPTTITASEIIVFLGRHNLNDYHEQDFVERDVRSLVINPEYDGISTPNADADLAILQLVTPVTFSAYIRPICLWSEPMDISLIANKQALVAGWRRDKMGEILTALPEVLAVKIASEAECLDLQNPFINTLKSITTLCAGPLDTAGPCDGDRRGGLMLKRNGRWTLRGIASVGLSKQNNCDLRQLVLYCDLAKHMTWVRSNLV